jgi:hypothetical protein
MTEERDKTLCAKYPKIFRNRRGDPKQTLMCFGFEHDDGWFDIIDTLCHTIQHHLDWKRGSDKFKGMPDEEWDECHQTVAVQVKEKWGGLRFYVSNSDDYIDGAISLAESLSLRTCEQCGAPGRPRGGGWVRTLCDGHAK